MEPSLGNQDTGLSLGRYTLSGTVSPTSTRAYIELSFEGSDDTYGTAIESRVITSSSRLNSAADLGFFTKVAGGNLRLERMTITSAGNVGIGTTTPTGLLDVASRGITKGSLPAGSVLQVVQGTSGAQATTTSGNWDSTGLTASITPTSSSSKILVLVSGGMEGGAGGSGDQSIGFKVYRGASSIEASTKGKVIYALPNIYVPINFIALDSPATTSSTAYTLYFNRLSGNTTASFCRDSLETANIVLMEIAA
jgi:hypothetical protein